MDRGDVLGWGVTLGEVHICQFGKFKGGVVVVRPFNPPPSSFHHVFEGCVGICEGITGCDEGAVIDKTCREFVFTFGNINEVCIIEGIY